MCWYMPTCADKCRHVPTCDINQDTSYNDHLDLIWMLACVSICGHAGICWYVPTCAGMCRHVTLISTLQIATISTLSGCWHVSVSVDICRYVLICAGMCWHVPTCANMWHYSRHLWWRSFRLYLDAGICQHLWTCRHVLICANMCRHVPTCETTLSTSDTNHLKRLHAGMCQQIGTCRYVLICADMCWHVLTCADMCQHVTLTLTPLIAII